MAKDDESKEVAAFIASMERRMRDPSAPARGRHWAAFLAVQPLVEAALARRHTMKATWSELREQGKVSMTYESFRSYCRKAGLTKRRRDQPNPRATGARGGGAQPGTMSEALRSTDRDDLL